MNPHVPRPWRRAAAAALALSFVAALPQPAPSSAEPGDDGGAGATGDAVDAKKAEAARLAAEIDRQGARISVLAEQVNVTRLEVQRLAEREKAAQDSAERAAREVARVQRRIRDHAVSAYVRGGSAAALSMLIEGTDDDLSVRNQYVDAVVSSGRELAAELDDARERHDRERLSLSEARRGAELAEATAKRAADEASALDRLQRASLARVQGDLGRLVAQEQARRAAEERARVQAELEAERRRRAAVTTTTAPRASTSTTTGRGATSTTAPRVATTTTVPSDGGAPVGPGPKQHPGADKAVAEAKRQIGKPYEWGGSGPDTFDCSGLTSWAWRAGGRSLPHSSQAQYSATVRIGIESVIPGDLLFYGNPIHHVGIAIGNGQMVEASQTGTPVRYASIYRRDFTGAGRVT